MLFRSRPSVEISVAAIEGGIEEWLSQQRARDLTHLIADLSVVTWKSSPKCSYLAKFAPLYKIFAKFAANGVLPTKKTSLALVALHGKAPINFTAKSVVDWADEIGAILRCTFGKYRELAFGRNHAEQYRITMGNASDDEKRAIDEVACEIKAAHPIHSSSHKTATNSTRHPRHFGSTPLHFHRVSLKFQ